MIRRWSHSISNSIFKPIFRLFRRKYQLFHECFPDREEVRIVDRKHLNRDPAGGCSTGEFGLPPLEMLTPLVLPWMEQPDKFPGGGISSCNIRAFVPVAVKAGQARFSMTVGPPCCRAMM